MRRVATGVAAIAMASAVSGCAVIIDNAMNRAGTRIGQQVGDAVGKTVGDAVAGAVQTSILNLTPELMQLYTQALFVHAFHNGGAWWDEPAYEPGQWTRWQAENLDQTDTFEKAFLLRTAEGDEWWQLHATTAEDGRTETITIEALFEPSSDGGTRTLKRLRRKFPSDEEPVEVPVTEESSARWYAEPRRLTDASMEGGRQGEETVEVPAGSFDCVRYRFAEGAGTVDWWISDAVPGGVVKAVRVPSSEGGAEPVRTVLVAHGATARTRLSSFDE